MEILTEVANKIGFDWKLALSSLINFLIIFVLLVKFALPALKKIIDERTKKIQEGLRLRNEADKIVEQAKREGGEIKSEANVKAESIISRSEISSKEILLQANSKAGEIIQIAEKEKLDAKQKGLQDAESILLKDLPDILSKISNNAFSGKVSAEINNDFVKNIFKI